MSSEFKCKCGFVFAITGFRNCEAFITSEGKSGVICPDCGTCYVDRREVTVLFHEGGQVVGAL